MRTQFENEEPEEEDDGDKIAFAQVALYQVNGDLDKEDSDDERDERKTLDPDYLYLDSCSNYRQMLKIQPR